MRVLPLLLSLSAFVNPFLPLLRAGTGARPPAASDGYGTSHVFLLQASDPEGNWLVACQARKDTDGDGEVSVFFNRKGAPAGDELAPYLFLGPGPGERIDGFLAADASGRHLVVARKSALWLLDTRSRTETELARLQPLEGQRTSVSSPLAAAFSPDGRRLLFLRKQESRVAAIVRELDSGREYTVDPGEGELLHAQLDPTGDWVVMDVLARDTHGNGRLDFHGPPAHPQCHGPRNVMAFTHYISGPPAQPDKPVRRMRRVAGGPLFEGDDLLQPVGSYVLRRGSQRELLVEDSGGHRVEWVPSQCKGMLLHVDAARGLLVVACMAQAKNGAAPVELHGATVHQKLAVTVEAPERDLLFRAHARFVELIPPDKHLPTEYAPAVLLDLEQHSLHPLHGRLVHVRGTRAFSVEYASPAEPRPEGFVLGQSHRLWLLDLTTGEKTDLGAHQTALVTAEEPAGALAPSLAGPLALFRGVMVDMNAGRVLGRLLEQPVEVLALDTRKRLLHPRPNQDPPQARALVGWLPRGPVRWLPAFPR